MGATSNPEVKLEYSVQRRISARNKRIADGLLNLVFHPRLAGAYSYRRHALEYAVTQR